VKFLTAGGRAAGGSATSGAGDATAVTTRVTLGEIPLGQGHVRIIGGLLPQPSTQYDHPLGLEPYSLTYSGYLIFCNLVNCKYEAKKRPALVNEPAPPGPVGGGVRGNVDKTFGVKLQTPRLASDTLRGRKILLRIRRKGIKAMDHFILQYRKTGGKTKKKYKTINGNLPVSTRRMRFKKGKLGTTLLFRIRAVGKNGRVSPFSHSRTVFPYDDRGKGRRYSGRWHRVKAKRAWRGGFTRSRQPGATLRFKTAGGGRVFIIGTTTPKGGKAMLGRGKNKRVISFRSKKKRNRRVVAVVNRTPKRGYRLLIRVIRGEVNIDGIGVRRR
jgi:hypothetical protein